MATDAMALAGHDPLMARLLAKGGVPPLRRRPPGLEGLAAIVVSQQISTTAAAAIWGRLTDLVRPLEPGVLLATPDDVLGGTIGLSRPKIRTLRALAGAIQDGSLPLDRLGDLEAEAAQAALVAVPGIGPWTAEVYLLFCLGHADAFAAGDLALQEAARLAAGLPRRPDRAALLAMAERWRPWRGVAAGLLWAFYRRTKSREGALAAA